MKNIVNPIFCTSLAFLVCTLFIFNRVIIPDQTNYISKILSNHIEYWKSIIQNHFSSKEFTLENYQPESLVTDKSQIDDKFTEMMEREKEAMKSVNRKLKRHQDKLDNISMDDYFFVNGNTTFCANVKPRKNKPKCDKILEHPERGRKMTDNFLMGMYTKYEMNKALKSVYNR